LDAGSRQPIRRAGGGDDQGQPRVRASATTALRTEQWQAADQTVERHLVLAADADDGQRLGGSDSGARSHLDLPPVGHRQLPVRIERTNQ
jgi:hypothetical protein